MPFSRYKALITSSYFYKGTSILKNKLKIKNKKDLEEAETTFTNFRIGKLYETPIMGFEIIHLKKIHKYIFQDLYSFSGKVRTESISKGNTLFCIPDLIQENLEILLKNLKNENYLKGLNKDEFSNRCSYYLAELNIIHPFREGNGRVIREFIRCLALNAGYIINWNKIEHEEFLNACIISVSMNYKPLKDCIEASLI